MPTIFSKIVTGDIPAHKVAETDDYLAFLDINLSDGLVFSLLNKLRPFQFEIIFVKTRTNHKHT